MAEHDRHIDRQRRFSRDIDRKARRKRSARERKDEQSIWFGLGMFGLVGWAVAVPTVIGIAVGVWLDSSHEGSISWTLTMLTAGVVLGCLNAWYWVSRERASIEQERDHPKNGENSNE